MSTSAQLLRYITTSDSPNSELQLDKMTISNEFDEYWKLDTYENLTKPQILERLKAIGHTTVRNSWTKRALATVPQRHDRGFMCFDKYSPIDLHEFARNRNLSRREHHRNWFHAATDKNLGSLIQDLEQSDRQWIFPRFTELPAELRRIIYGFYIADFPGSLRLPTKPPLSRTCKLLRQEVLPMFYGNVELQIELKQDSNNPRRFAESINTQLFLLHLASADAACIRRLKLVVARRQSCVLNTGDEVQKAFHIDLGSSKDDFRVTPTVCDSCWRCWWDAQSCRFLLHGIVKLVEGLSLRDGRRVFRLEDIHGLRRVVEEASNHSCA